MLKVQGVSFPRSGHHLLAYCLEQYFGKEFGYCNDVFRIHQFQESWITYQKNHDFDLDLPIDHKMRYLIQYRHPLESLVSWYKWEVDNGITAEMNYGWRPQVNKYVPLWNLYAHRNTQKRWMNFLNIRIPFWSKFGQKWIISNHHPSTCWVNYSDLIRAPFITISGVISFFDPEAELDEEKLQKIITHLEIRPRNDITEFEFYNERSFRKIEKSLKHKMNLADIQALFL
ncbi:MAG: hypothetical protein GVY20_15900 [Bacteroidetes bacterium]|jgi:hypothetical protein|nr:hypothetical protein [Bacteroidota bacterium]